MTPGFAKPREELPWLPYGECSRVIINAHNFTPADPFAVNGKTPLGVWCPSRDSLGNGTATVYDLKGTANGTFNGTSPAIGWVADTDAGGVRAVFFNGTYKSVEIPAFATGVTAWSICYWAKLSTFTLPDAFPGMISFNDGSVYLHAPYNSNLAFYNSRSTVRPTISVSLNTWYHVGLIETGSVGQLYINGSFIANFTGGTAGSINSRKLSIGRINATAGTITGRFDDCRVFATALNASDFSYLWNSGLGRGRQS